MDAFTQALKSFSSYSDDANPTKIKSKIKPDFKNVIHFGRSPQDYNFVDVSIRKHHLGFGRKVDSFFTKEK